MTKKKHKKHGGGIPPADDLRARVNRAASEGRFQHALELAKQLYKGNPSSEHRALLHTVYLGRARQLRQQGSTRDAATVLQAALQPPGLTPEWKSQIAAELAACGEAAAALALAGQGQGAGAAPIDEKLLAQVVDAAVANGLQGRGQLPAAHQPDYDRIINAFHQLEAGQDEAVRATLQGIGLRSPFLEWKLMLRGLQAYYQQDDERALENWQRLNHERLPARLVAPLRFNIDRPYQAAQPAATQAALQRQAGRLQGTSPVQQLRDLQRTLVGQAGMAQVFRQADAVAATLRLEAPHLLPRLASCLYWAVLHNGQPDDVPRYQRVFGTPADDPGLHRLQAMGWERSGYMEEAHRHWQQFEKAVADHPEAWPGEQAKRVRALVWQHMGRNAASVPDDDDLDGMPSFLRNHPDRPQPLNPSAEQCFRKSLVLAPDQVETHEELFRYYREQEEDDKAVRAAKELLERFPDRVEALAELGDLHMKRQEYAAALSCFQRALKNNPLDRKLRGRVSTAHVHVARTYAEAGNFDEARREYQASLTMGEGGNRAVYCKWAACEFKAGDTARGEELLQKGLAEAGNELAVAYSMLIEVIRLKLHGSYKTRFNNAFNEGLAAAPTGQAAAELAATTASHHSAGVTYLGQKTHQKKVLDYLKKAEHVSYTETELERLCTALLLLESYRLTNAYCRLGQRKFPKNPLFPFLEAQSELSRGSGSFNHFQVRKILERARRLAEALPTDKKQEELLDQIQERLSALGSLNPFARLFGGDFDPFGYDDDADDGW